MEGHIHRYYCDHLLHIEGTQLWLCIIHFSSAVRITSVKLLTERRSAAIKQVTWMYSVLRIFWRDTVFMGKYIFQNKEDVCMIQSRVNIIVQYGTRKPAKWQDDNNLS